MLFDQFERTETRTKRNGESDFSYLNSSAREPLAAAREVLEQWFAAYPEGGRADLRARLRSPNDAQHQSAFWELYLHELFSQLGFTLEPHPQMEGTPNHPDFLVKEADVPKFYLEAIVAGLPSAKEAGADARLADVFDLVNKMPIKGWFLHVEHRGMSDTQPPTKELRMELKAWLASQDIAAVNDALKAEDWDNLPRFEWQYEGLTLAFTPSPKSPKAAAKPDSKPIGIVVGEAYQLKTDEDIRRAVEAKAKKYGSLPLPLLVAVNAVTMHCDDYDINNALFGREIIRATRTPEGAFAERSERLPDGVWFGKKGPRNGGVSAVMVGNRVGIYRSGSTTPLLLHNPYPTHRLNLPSYPLPQSIPDEKTHEMRRKVGMNASAFLRLPKPWPPNDD